MKIFSAAKLLAVDRLIQLSPGVLAAAAVAVTASLAAPATSQAFPIPAMVLALVIGILANPVVRAPAYHDGLVFCVKKLLRWAVALLGLRIALGDILQLGLVTVAVVVAAMTATILTGFAMARLLGQRSEFGALAGSATAVCGASATLATASVLPGYKGKEADIAFVVIAVNALSTVAMLAYPPIALLAGFDDTRTGIMLGATIHDVAQVVGAGYAVSEEAGNSAVVVKLFRVFLLLPIVLTIGWWFLRARAEFETCRVSVPAPIFAYVFLALVVLNSAMENIAAVAPVWEPMRAALISASSIGLLVAISALGLTTSLYAIKALGWRHVATVMATTLFLFTVVTAALMGFS